MVASFDTSKERRCRYCGRPILTENLRALYCSDGCRRSFQNERRKMERREAAEQQERYATACANVRDPWQARDLTDEDAEILTSNCLQDGGQAMPEGFDMIEYYKERIAKLYQAGFEQWVQKLMEEPDPAEQAEGGEV